MQWTVAIGVATTIRGEGGEEKPGSGSSTRCATLVTHFIRASGHKLGR
jgi:hypothetical protein